MDKSPINEMMETTMQKVREMIDANTIVGEPITTPDAITLIPVSRVSLGIAGGGLDSAKKPEAKETFGGGIGAGIKVEPVAFAVVKNGDVSLLYIAPPEASALDKFVDAVPDIIDKASDIVKAIKE